MIDGSERITRRTLLVIGAGAALVPLAGLTIGCDDGGAADPYAEEPVPRPGPDAAQAPARTQPEAGATPGAARPPEAAQAGAPADTAQPAQTAPAAGEAEKLVTEIPAMEPLVTSLTYTNESQKPDQRCNNCLLFTQTSDDRGKCQLFAQGVVAAQGWCMSWAAKPAPAG
jgi:hypothetical protein